MNPSKDQVQQKQKDLFGKRSRNAEIIREGGSSNVTSHTRKRENEICKNNYFLGEQKKSHTVCVTQYTQEHAKIMPCPKIR